MVVKTGDFAQSVVSAAMGIAGQVIQRFELTEDGNIDRRAECLLHLVEGGDLIAQQQRAQFIGVIGDGSHNVIVPTRRLPPIRNYNKSGRRFATADRMSPKGVFSGRSTPAADSRPEL